MLIPSTSPSRSQRLDVLTQARQQALLASPVIAAIAAAAIRLRMYVALLRALRGIHATMDARLPELPLRLPIAPLLRLPLLDADLRVWDPSVIMRAPATEPRIAALDGPGLIGALYALEGSRLALSSVAPGVARAFALPDASAAGLRYLGTADPQQWLACTSAIDRLALPVSHEDGVDDGASATMDMLLAHYRRIAV